MESLTVRWLGRVPYSDASAEQARLVAARRRGTVADTLLLLEHPPVITVGRSGQSRNVLADDGELARRGIELHEAGRGGDVTYHGPGQLVGYPVLALPHERRDAHRYLRDLEQVLILTVAEFGVEACRVPGLTGIWVGQDKVAAIGVRLSTGWITSHGFALNVAPDISGFSTIVPCGLADRGVTSLARLTGTNPGLRSVAGAAARHLAAVFDLRPVDPRDPDERLVADRVDPLSWDAELQPSPSPQA